MTGNPCREFVKQRIQLFSEDFPEQKTLIYDNAPQFMSIDYSSYDIKGVNTSPAAPNKRSVRKEVNIELVTVGLILGLDCNMNA